MKRHSMKRQSNLALLSLALGLGGAEISAQDDDPFILREIIVTATKREQSTQDIPMSVAALTGDILVKGNIEDLTDMSASVPNFTIAEGLGTNIVAMRGMSSSGGDRGFEQSVGMYVDGIYKPRSRQYYNAFLDISRIEVLRGPQAVLFGVNSTAGAINIVSATNRPGDELEASIAAEYELEYDSAFTTLTLGGGLNEKLGGRLVVKHIDKGGFYTQAIGGEEGEKRSTAGRLSLVWEPTDNVVLTTKVDYFEEMLEANLMVELDAHSEVRWRQNYDASTLALLGKEPGRDGRGNNTTVTLDVNIGDHTLTAVAGYSDFNNSQRSDTDAQPLLPYLASAGDPTPYNFFDSDGKEEYDQASLEVRWASPTGNFTDYIVGAYFQQSNLFDRSSVLLGLGEDIGGYANLEVDQALYSVFATLTFNLGTDLRATLGARYNDESKDAKRTSECGVIAAGLSTFDQATCDAFNSQGGFRAATAPNHNNSPSAKQDLTSHNFLPELMLQWDYAEDRTLYGRVGKSVKSGGMTSSFNVPTPDRLTFDDEKVLGYELGLKSRFANGRAEVNAAIFRSDFEDLQVISFTAVGSAVTNAGEAYTQGIEVDGQFAWTEWLTVGASVALLDAEYDKYTNATCNLSGSTPESSAGCDASGEKLAYAADYSGNLFVDIEYGMTSELNLLAGLSLSFSDNYHTETTFEPLFVQDRYIRYDARLGIGAEDGSWSLSLIGKNLGDENIAGLKQNVQLTNIGFVAAPRTVAVQGVFNF